MTNDGEDGNGLQYGQSGNHQAHVLKFCSDFFTLYLQNLIATWTSVRIDLQPLLVFKNFYSNEEPSSILR